MTGYFPSHLVEYVITQKCNMGCSYCFGCNKEMENVSIEKADEITADIFYNKIRLIGGEPFLNMPAIEKVCQNLSDNSAFNDPRTIRISTNGTLIRKNIDILKKLNVCLTISLDGPKEINDIDRVYNDKSGSFNDVMDGINLCIENDIPWDYAVTLSKNKLPHLLDTFIFIYELNKKMPGIKTVDGAIDKIVNSANIITNMDIDDNDINIFLAQQYSIFEYIISMDLTFAQQKRLCTNWFKKAVAPEWTCDGSTGKMALAENDLMYPCLALALDTTDNNYHTYKIHDVFIDYNFNETTFSSNIDRNSSKYAYWYNTCAAHNLSSGSSVFYQNCKFNLMIDEYNRFVDELFSYYGII